VRYREGSEIFRSRIRRNFTTKSWLGLMKVELFEMLLPVPRSPSLVYTDGSGSRALSWHEQAVLVNAVPEGSGFGR